MAIQTTYTAARARLAELLDRATEDRETIVITRHGSPDAVLLAADEYRGLVETAHLLRSPRNAERLLRAIRDSIEGNVEARTVESLRQDLGPAEPG